MFHVKHSFEITGFQLKIAAIVAMTCNHVANVFGALLPEPLDFALYAVGGVTFPIMAFLLVEGYAHTSDLRKYALRLAGFAVVSQIPYYLVFQWPLNVLFTLLIGLGILWLCDRFNSGVGLIAALAGTVLLQDVVDWGTTGLVIIYLFATLRGVKRGSAGKPSDVPAIIGTMAIPMAVTCFSAIRFSNLHVLGYALVGYTIATLLLCGYRGRRGRPMKWFFYAYYPLHLFVIWVAIVILL
jgi:TraX protein.